MCVHPDPRVLPIEKAYDEVGVNYRYFLTWRHRLFAGYLVVIAFLAVGVPWIFQHAREILWAPFACGLLLTLVFWVLEYRNRDLYHAAQRCGEALENTIGSSNGIYTELNSIKGNFLCHSTAIDGMFLAALVLLFCGLCWAI